MPGTATPINGTCVVGPPTQDAAFFIYTCTRPPANNKQTPVASCPADIPGTRPTGSRRRAASRPRTNFPSQPSPQCVVGPPVTDSDYITTTCTKPLEQRRLRGELRGQRWLDAALHQGDLSCAGSRRR